MQPAWNDGFIKKGGSIIPIVQEMGLRGSRRSELRSMCTSTLEPFFSIYLTRSTQATINKLREKKWNDFSGNPGRLLIHAPTMYRSPFSFYGYAWVIVDKHVDLTDSQSLTARLGLPQFWCQQLWDQGDSDSRANPILWSLYMHLWGSKVNIRYRNHGWRNRQQETKQQRSFLLVSL